MVRVVFKKGNDFFREDAVYMRIGKHIIVYNDKLSYNFPLFTIDNIYGDIVYKIPEAHDGKVAED